MLWVSNLILLFSLTSLLAYGENEIQNKYSTLILKKFNSNQTVKINFSSLEKPIALIFLSSKCRCNPETFMAINTTIEKLKNFKFSTYVISEDPNLKASLLFYKKINLFEPMFWDSDHSLADKLSVLSAPYGILLSKSGYVIYRGPVVLEKFQKDNTFKTTAYLQNAASEYNKTGKILISNIPFIGCAIKKGVLFEN